MVHYQCGPFPHQCGTLNTCTVAPECNSSQQLKHILVVHIGHGPRFPVNLMISVFLEYNILLSLIINFFQSYFLLEPDDLKILGQ